MSKKTLKIVFSLFAIGIVLLGFTSCGETETKNEKATNIKQATDEEIDALKYDSKPLTQFLKDFENNGFLITEPNRFSETTVFARAKSKSSGNSYRIAYTVVNQQVSQVTVYFRELDDKTYTELNNDARDCITAAAKALNKSETSDKLIDFIKKFELLDPKETDGENYIIDNIQIGVTANLVLFIL